MRKLLIALFTVVIVGCSSKAPLKDRGDYYTDSAFPSQSQNNRIRFLVFHYTAADDATSLKILTKGEVSAHYLVPSLPKRKDGKPIILQLVPEENRAWHAGVSHWNGRSNINDSSIGIEIVNKGFTEDMLGHQVWYPFNEQQISAIAVLAKDIIKRNNITLDNVIAHSDIAPLRKSDPGKLFPWQRLAEMGIGVWPNKETVEQYLAGRSPDTPADVLTIQKALSQYGYDEIPQSGILDEKTRKTISAFQMHFRQRDISGKADAETESIAKALIEKYRSNKT
ncbi:N-acetylmuramoyl-L-alanine amidase [Chania multitudinisentens RB-25]|uniref:N-acetylmuramoyl-L-alanine amidase n=1 Tax=Chania multitudinisentens RB-25 TaxID=1441930 RepID=W0L9S3_9GAMM|nr:N-acetylmuramoyl-L-alanine amidase [Chania multitudinisentens]AHG19017.1 N-acetylmuramoyl-L-alanine amidase [Chania multitudinisentens RB-25]